MLSSLTTRIALKKVGLPSDAFDFSGFGNGFSSDPSRQPNKLRKDPPWVKAGLPPPPADAQQEESWSSWLSVKSLPLSVQPWLAPPTPSVSLAAIPQVGQKAPVDQVGKLKVGGKKTLVLFLRCVGCAFAKEAFINLRTISNRHNGAIRCVAVSHSSAEATKKWLDYLGGAWDIEIIIDEDRSVYSAWGLGLGNIWYLLNPTTQKEGWKAKGWLGDKVAEAVEKSGPVVKLKEKGGNDQDDGAVTTMGNKWQEAGAFAVDVNGTVIWGGKAVRADDVMNLDEGAQLLML